MIFTPRINLIPLLEKEEFIYSQIILFGLNYSFRRLRRRRILFNLQYANKMALHLPKGLIGRVYKRRLVLFGQKNILQQVIHAFIELRPGNIYTGKGLRVKTERYYVKPVKVKGRR